MHTFFRKRHKKLKMHRLTARELGPLKVEMINLLAPSRDPFSSVEYILDAGPCKQLIKTYAEKTGKRITLTPVINKLLALAISENPEFNRMIFSSRAYQLEEVHIANTVLIPGTDSITYVILESPQQKPLGKIQQELFSGISDTSASATGQQDSPIVTLLTNLCYRTGAYRIIGQRRTFTLAFEQGLMANHTLSNHVYDTQANFFMRKDIQPAIYDGIKYHLSWPKKEPVASGDTVTLKEMMHLFVKTDHRLISGVHSHRFGKSLERIAANPENFM